MKTDGTVAATYTGTIAAGTNVFVDTVSLGIPANQAGQAILTHNGPPGGILPDGFIQNPVTWVIQLTPVAAARGRLEWHRIRPRQPYPV